MDRRNGGDLLAPPRPPKLQPRVHRPRYPDPPTMSDSLTPPLHPRNPGNNHHMQQQNLKPSTIQESQQLTQQQTQQQQQQCTHSLQNRNTNILNIRSSNVCNRSRSSSSSSSSGTTSPTHLVPTINVTIHTFDDETSIPIPQATITASPTTSAPTTVNINTSTINQTPAITSTSFANLNRNNSNLSSTTITSVNSFTRRRPPPSPLLPSLSLTNNINNLNSLLPALNIFHSVETPGSPVTLAAPRPEAERLTNEYVDTPFRSTKAQLIHNSTRNEHPAGQTAIRPISAQHSFLLQQYFQDQSHQPQQHHSSHHQSNSQNNEIISGTPSTSRANPSPSDIFASGIDGDIQVIASYEGHTNETSSILHSNTHIHKGNNCTKKLATTTTTMGTSGTGIEVVEMSSPTSTISSNSQKFRATSALGISQPITKQPKNNLPGHLNEDYDLHSVVILSPLPVPVSSSRSISSAPVSITCPQCNRCRCAQCQGPRQLPSTWVCNKTCLCSAESCIDYTSCLCCVKALFYHCSKDEDVDCDHGEGISCLDEPCSCLPYKRATRWGWLGALSFVLPCLCCYWPLRGICGMCTKCYGRCRSKGCQCEPNNSNSSMLPIGPISHSPGLRSKTSGVSGGVHSGISGSHHHHNHHHHHHNHHHHHHNSGNGNGAGIGGNASNKIARKCDLAPGKRLLDSNPEY